MSSFSLNVRWDLLYSAIAICSHFCFLAILAFEMYSLKVSNSTSSPLIYSLIQAVFGHTSISGLIIMSSIISGIAILPSCFLWMVLKFSRLSCYSYLLFLQLGVISAIFGVCNFTFVIWDTLIQDDNTFWMDGGRPFIFIVTVSDRLRFFQCFLTPLWASHVFSLMRISSIQTVGIIFWILG